MMMKDRVVHCKKARYDVYVGRPSKWGHEAALALAAPDVFCEVCGFDWPADDRCPFH